jgi:heme-degrading monooxygenase HmoA
MFARRVSVDLKPNTVADFTDRLENEVVPLLRKQKGFQDEIEFVAPGGDKAFAISLWDRKESAETFGREVYPQVEKILSKFYEGKPRIETFEVPYSTIHTSHV